MGGPNLSHVLSVGAVITETDHRGLNIDPTTEIAVCIGVDGAIERAMFKMSPSIAREFAGRMIEICDQAQKGE